jgi:integrating conjugative element protein (TIGR03765 family)
MTPGVLTGNFSIERPVWLVHPVFLIGSDITSRTWLEQNAAMLRQAHATGIVLDVASYDEFRRMQMIADGVPLAPASADGFARTLGVTVYPVLIRLDGSVVQ